METTFALGQQRLSLRSDNSAIPGAAESR